MLGGASALPRDAARGNAIDATRATARGAGCRGRCSWCGSERLDRSSAVAGGAQVRLRDQPRQHTELIANPLPSLHIGTRIAWPSLLPGIDANLDAVEVAALAGLFEKWSILDRRV